MSTLYRKTPKGHEEIETRAHRLPPRQRSALIVVDGKRRLDELRGLIAAQADETLQALAEQGFIEVVADVPAAAGTAAPPPRPTASGPASEFPPSGLPGQASADFDQTRRAAVRALNDELGPAGESLSIKMEKARNLGELLPLLVQGAQAIANVRGRAAAEGFARRFGVI